MTPDPVYLIAHTPRTGSNWLCEVLATTGQVGIGHVNRAGLFVGYGEGLAKPGHYPTKVNEYFCDSKTANGITGMKTGWDYLDLLDKHFVDGAVDEILGRYTDYIHLQRKDMVAQSVSWWVAAWSGVFTSVNAGKPDKKNPADTPYDYDQILRRYKSIEADNTRWRNHFKDRGIKPLVVYYETMQRPGGMSATVKRIFKHLGLAKPANIITEVTLERQPMPLKQVFIERFKGEAGV